MSSMISPKSSTPVFLDVDTSIVEDNLNFLKEDQDEFNKLFGSTHPSYPSKLVKPFPGFCVKTKEVATEKKVFINICHTEAIPPPRDVTESELMEILESDSAGDYRVPMSLGEIHPVKDKKGQEAKACDIAIHPQFLKKVEGSQAFKNFFMAIVFQGLENKYGLVCADEKIILRNIKAYGTLQTHRVQQREIEEKMGKSGERSLIEEITHAKEGDKKQVTIETLASTENGIKKPEYRLYKKKDGQNCLIGQFKLPDVISAREVTLDIGEDRILLESKIRGYLLDIFIPYIVKQKTCSSSFDRTSKILTVTMPLVGG